MLVHNVAIKEEGGHGMLRVMTAMMMSSMMMPVRA